MKFNKLSKTSVSLLFIMVSVAILIIPASAISYSETLTTQNILSVQGDYVNGTGIQTIAINQTLPTSDFRFKPN
jgi:ABC-type lipoprotein release transport system permease subunit